MHEIDRYAACGEAAHPVRLLLPPNAQVAGSERDEQCGSYHDRDCDVDARAHLEGAEGAEAGATDGAIRRRGRRGRQAGRSLLRCQLRGWRAVHTGAAAQGGV